MHAQQGALREDDGPLADRVDRDIRSIQRPEPVEEARFRARQQSLEVLDIRICYSERFEVANALIKSRKNRELAPERVLPEVELEDAFHFMSIVAPVRIGHGDLVKVCQERADQWVRGLAGHGGHTAGFFGAAVAFCDEWLRASCCGVDWLEQSLAAAASEVLASALQAAS